MILIIEWTTGSIIGGLERKSIVFDTITDISLNFYDEIAISRIAVPEWKVSVFRDCSSVNNTEWQRIFRESYQRLVFAKLISNNGEQLATGRILSWTEKRESSELELTVTSPNNLENEVSFTNTENYTVHTRASLETIVGLCLYWFNDIWQDSQINATYTFNSGTNLQRFSPIARVIRDKLISYPVKNVVLTFLSSYTGKKKDFLKHLSQLINTKFVQDSQGNFNVFSFSDYQSNPILVNGFISNVSYELTEENFLGMDWLNTVRFSDISGGSGSSDNITSKVKDSVRSAMSKFIRYTTYDIWGHAEDNSIIKSGQTITVDGINYYIRDIDYDKETLDSLRSFKAVGVRFTS